MKVWVISTNLFLIPGATADRYRIHNKLAGTLTILAAFVQCFLFFTPSAIHQLYPSQNCTMSLNVTSCDGNTSSFPTNIIIKGALPPHCVLYCCDISSNISLKFDNDSLDNIMQLEKDSDVRWNCSAFRQETLYLDQYPSCRKYDLVSHDNTTLCQSNNSNQRCHTDTIILSSSSSSSSSSSCSQIYQAFTRNNTHDKFGETFWIYFGIYSLANVIMYPIGPLRDAIAYALLGNQRNSWGRQRVWGEIQHSISISNNTIIPRYCLLAVQLVRNFCYYKT